MSLIAIACSGGSDPPPATDAGSTSSGSSSGSSGTSGTSGTSGGSVKCSGPGGSSGGGGGKCTATGEWKCGADSYDVECECPAATCHCKKNGGLLKSVGFAGCKPDGNCDATLVAAGECGVPL